MLMRKGKGALLLLAAVAACNDPPVLPGPPPEFSIFPSRQWSGGEVEIVSPYFADITTDPRVTLDSSTLSTRRVNDSTFAVRLPSVPSCSYQLVVKSPDGPYDAGNVQVFGYRDSQTVPIRLLDFLSTATLSQGQVALGSIDYAGGPRVAALNLSTGAVTTFFGLSAIGQSIGPSFRGPDVAMLVDTAGVLGEWRLLSTPALLAGAMPWLFSVRAVAALGPGSYLVFDGKSASTIAGDFQVESVERVYLSPSGDRAAIAASVTLPGIPVFDMTTGDTAYTLPIQTATSAAFSRNGSRFYALGGYPPNMYLKNKLFLLGAASGNVLAQDSLPASTTRGNALALDLGESLLFVAAEEGALAQVLVYDALTLDLLGTLKVPPGVGEDCFGPCQAGTIVADESSRTIYYVVSGNQVVVYRFDLMR